MLQIIIQIKIHIYSSTGFVFLAPHQQQDSLLETEQNGIKFSVMGEAGKRRPSLKQARSSRGGKKQKKLSDIYPYGRGHGQQLEILLFSLHLPPPSSLDSEQNLCSSLCASWCTYTEMQHEEEDKRTLK